MAHPVKFEDILRNRVAVNFTHAGDDMSLPIEKVEEAKKAVGDG